MSTTYIILVVFSGGLGGFMPFIFLVWGGKSGF